MNDTATCADCEKWRGEYNAAIANGLVGQARLIDRRLAAHEKLHRQSATPDPAVVERLADEAEAGFDLSTWHPHPVKEDTDVPIHQEE